MVSCFESASPESKIKKKIGVIDFETDPFKHGRFPKAFACGFHNGTSYLSKWGTHDAVVHWAARQVKQFDGIVYAHNGGKFDFLAYLLGAGGKALWGESVFCIGGRIVKLLYGQAELRDSYAILPAPLKAHDKGEIDYALFEEGVRHLHKRRILDYLSRDCHSLLELVIRFIDTHGLQPLTAASAGMKFAKKLGLNYEKFNDSQDEKFRQWYYGGLVLARKPGIHRGQFTLYDIKSAYPYAMLHEHASGRDFSFSSDKRSILPQSFVVVQGTGCCFLRRTDEGNRYGGDGQFHVTGWEYLEAIRTGNFRGKVVYVETPEQTINFTSYVNHFFDEKAACEASGDKAGRLIAKIMLNSLYGKFAQRNDRFRDYFLWPDSPRHPIPDGFEIEAQYDEFKLIVISKPSPHRGLYNVATAASITGFVRAMLMKAIHETDPYYCDTDSVLVDSDKVPSSSMPDGSLGSWGMEVRGDLLAIAGKKLYALRLLASECANLEDATRRGYHWYEGRAWKIASKGCRLTPVQMLALCRGEEINYLNDAPSYSLLNSPHFVKRTIRRTATCQ